MSEGRHSYEAVVSIAVVVVLCGFGLYFGLTAINEAKRFQSSQTLRGIGRLMESSSIRNGANWTAADVANTMGWRLCRERGDEECVSANRMKWKGGAVWRMCSKYQCSYIQEDGMMIWVSRLDFGKKGYIGKGVRGNEEKSFQYTWSK